jgi:hypothetical protein
MNFDLNKSISVLENTPMVLKSLLSGLSEEWTHNNEGPETWSPFDVVGHLVHGERTDWIPRIFIIMNDSEEKTFTPFDRFAQFEESKGKTLEDLLNEFETLRDQNLQQLKSFEFTESEFQRKGIHPELGEVTLSQVIATWVTHDLGHIAQINRVMAKQYKNEVGPWTAYISILSK